MPSPITPISKEFLDLSKHLNAKAFAISVQGSFHDFPDPRKYEVFYPAWFIVLIILSGFLAGCNTIKDIAGFARLRAGWFAETLGMVIKIPSYDVIWTFLTRSEPEGFKALLRRWFSSLPKELKDQLLVIDGKRLNGACKDKNIEHIVEMFAAESQLVLYQEKVPNKKSELAALPAILETVDVEGAIISADALYTQKKVAEHIVDKKADYILSLKDNQGSLCAETANLFDQINFKNSFDEVECYETIDKGHGRKEKRKIRVVNDLDWLPQLSQWKGLQSLIEVVSERKIGDKIERSQSFYISSRRADAKSFAAWIRSHWSIENNLHWVADVVFREDRAKNRLGNSAENMSILRRVAMNMVNLLDPGRGMTSARTIATHDPAYLTGLLAKLFMGSFK
jgi:predicted transposase YbfD/YdcC